MNIDIFNFVDNFMQLRYLAYVGASIKTIADGNYLFKVDGLNVNIHNGASPAGKGYRILDINSLTLGKFKIWITP